MRPLLAATIESVEKDVALPAYASVKIDGVRCLAYEGAAMSRSFKPLPNRYLRDLFCNRLFHGLDGELVDGNPVSKNCFNVTSSTVMSQSAPIDRVMFFVFDDFSCAGPYEERLKSVYQRIAKLNEGWLLALPQILHYDLTSLMNHEQQVVSLGYEGLMVRSPQAPYKYGRSTLNQQYLMKLKRFKDAEAKCVGYTELKRNANEATTSETGYQVRSSHKAGMVAGSTLGALTCYWPPAGRNFNIGTGFSAADRDELWEIRDLLPGRIVRFKYQEHGMLEVPRLPVFAGFRSMEDL